MKLIPLALLLACSLAVAKAPPKYQPDPDEAQLIEQGHYTNKAGKQPSGATAQCRDGTYSFSRTHRGTCSGHHGVASWLN